MAGYYGYSMSNNAVGAYNSGEMPLSKWTKANLISAIEDVLRGGDAEIRFSMDALKKLPLAALKELILEYSSWHHTSSHYNRTNFYSVNVDAISKLTDDRIADIAKKHNVKKESPKTVVRKCHFLTWGGTRNHRKCYEHVEECEVAGNWAMTSFGKKSIKANGFWFVD